MSQFVDEVFINLKGGDGGAGCVSFRREAMVDRGGPDGGDGGKGGDVWLVADHNTASLLSYRDHPHRKGENGKHGSGQKQHGKRGSDFVAQVPVGTIVKNRDGEILADLQASGERFLAAAGGQGGKGNARFLSNRMRAPAFAEQGEVGDEHWVRLELLLLADVALIGFPNAGKSTLISRISKARPKITNYPFTTLEPNLGVVQTDEGFDFVVADIPGLIEGASEGRGLGHQFLRHVERARALVVLLDMASVDGNDPDEQLDILLKELEAYRPDLLARPRLVIESRADVAQFEPNPERLQISSVTNIGVSQVIGRMADLVREARSSEPVELSEVVHRPEAEDIRIERGDDASWIVIGREAERAVAFSDLNNLDAQIFAEKRLVKLGVFKRLERAGIKEGDTVRIGELSFDYEEGMR